MPGSKAYTLVPSSTNPQRKCHRCARRPPERRAAAARVARERAATVVRVPRVRHRAVHGVVRKRERVVRGCSRLVPLTGLFTRTVEEAIPNVNHERKGREYAENGRTKLAIVSLDGKTETVRRVRDARRAERTAARCAARLEVMAVLAWAPAGSETTRRPVATGSALQCRRWTRRRRRRQLGASYLVANSRIVGGDTAQGGRGYGAAVAPQAEPQEQSDSRTTGHGSAGGALLGLVSNGWRTGRDALAAEPPTTKFSFLVFSPYGRIGHTRMSLVMISHGSIAIFHWMDTALTSSYLYNIIYSTYDAIVYKYGETI
jgi:hypothetical protein